MPREISRSFYIGAAADNTRARGAPSSTRKPYQKTVDYRTGKNGFSTSFVTRHGVGKKTAHRSNVSTCSGRQDSGPYGNSISPRVSVRSRTTISGRNRNLRSGTHIILAGRYDERYRSRSNTFIVRINYDDRTIRARTRCSRHYWTVAQPKYRECYASALRDETLKRVANSIRAQR